MGEDELTLALDERVELKGQWNALLQRRDELHAELLKLDGEMTNDLLRKLQSNKQRVVDAGHQEWLQQQMSDKHQ